MNPKLLKAVLINFALIISAFIIFIMIDRNTVNATRGSLSIQLEKNKISKNTNMQFSLFGPAKTVTNDFKQIKPFDWTTNYYIDLNLPFADTNIKTVLVSSNTSAAIAFYPEKQAYYRFEIPRFTLKGDINPAKAYVKISKDNSIIPAYFGPTNLVFLKNTNNSYTASWFSGWQPQVGKYQAVLYVNGYPAVKKDFQIIQREPLKFNRKITFLNLEWNQMIDKRTVFDPKGQKALFPDALQSWMDFGDIDGFLTLTGETTGWGNLNPADPWEYYPQKNLEILGRQLHDRNKLVGAYIMCFYTPQDGWIKAGYQCAKGVTFDSDTGTWGVKGSKFASFKDPKRYKDIVDMAKKLEALPYVDMIGFDFIRFGELVGYENADEFARDMNVPLPENWQKYTENDRIIWLGSKLANHAVQERWRVWIAHKTADFIYRVRKDAGLTKPVWVFTLGWDHGTEHGQDPYFFQDAGVFSDLVMLYEASPDMNEAMKKSWTAYVKNGRLNYLPGNQFDAFLLKSINGYNPVEEFESRLDTGANYADYLSSGVFIHDMSRAFWGRRGEFSYQEWLTAGFSSASSLRWKNGEIPFHISIPNNKIFYTQVQSADVPIEIKIPEEKQKDLEGKRLIIEQIGNNYSENIDISGKTNIILNIKISPKLGTTQFLGLRGKIEGYPAYFTFSYIKLQYGSVRAAVQKKDNSRVSGE